MKILLLADINSPHTQKWAIGLANANLQIGLFSLHPPNNNWWQKHPNLHFLFAPPISSNPTILKKIQYLSFLRPLKQTIQHFQPHILHAHYATSYGLLGALSNFHPFILSIWGSDIYDFPKRFFLNHHILSYNLKKADAICSTSHSMANKAKQYTNKHIHVIPFGVDINFFSPHYKRKIFSENEIIIGTIKSLSPQYGIDTLLYTFQQILYQQNNNYNFKLLIVGDGSEKEKYMQLSKKLKINDKTIFYGKIDNNLVPQLLAEIDIFVALSNEESFGVAVIEAMGCGKPVVVSDAPGLKEIVLNNTTGFIVPKKNPTAASKAILKIIQSPSFFQTMKENARKHVTQHYNFQNNLQQLIQLYQQFYTK